MLKLVDPQVTTAREAGWQAVTPAFEGQGDADWCWCWWFRGTGREVEAMGRDGRRAALEAEVAEGPAASSPATGGTTVG